MEYDNTQNNANHAHAVWRDAERDFGRDLLREHYDRDPHHGAAKRVTTAGKDGTTASGAEKPRS
jgi:hypothetical protein